jgi:hypothetical protein
MNAIWITVVTIRMRQGDRHGRTRAVTSTVLLYGWKYDSLTIQIGVKCLIFESL